MFPTSTFSMFLLLATLATAHPVHANPGDNTPVTPAEDLSGIGDFAFEVGHWRVRHRVLKAQPDGTQQWLEYDGTSHTREVMGGQANVEDNVFRTPEGVRRGVAIRSYDRSKGTWAIWWIDGRYPHGAMDPPMIGRFADGVGTFYSESMLDGKPVRTRFIWSHITPQSARWEQALSYDAGKTWQVNWVMTFEREPG